LRRVSALTLLLSTIIASAIPSRPALPPAKSTPREEVKQETSEVPPGPPPQELKPPARVARKLAKLPSVPIVPTWQCVSGRGLTILNKKDIAQAFVKLELPLYSGETLTLIRRGDSLVLSHPPKRISAQRQQVMDRTLAAQLSPGALAAEVTRVTVRCGAP
jgi:hypothetical protein